MTTTCDQVTDQLAELVDGDRDAIACHAEHLAGCDACRDARHDAERLVAVVGDAGSDHVASDDLLARVLAAVERDMAARLPGATDASTGQPRHAAILAAVTTDATTTDATTDPTDPAHAPAGHAPAGHAPAGHAPAGHAPAGHAPAGHAPAGHVPQAHVAGRAVQTPDAHRFAPHRAAVLAGAMPSRRKRSRLWLAIGASAALAAGATGLAVQLASWRSAGAPPATVADAGPLGKLTRVERAAADGVDGVAIRIGDGWRPLRKDDPVPAGAELRTDDRTRAALELGDGTRLVLDHGTAIAFAAGDARQLRLAAGRLAADIAHVEGRPAAIATPSGRIDVVGTRLSVTATEAMTAVQVTRGAVVLTTARGEHDDVRAGEEGVIERGVLAVSAAPGLVRDTAWAELAPAAAARPDEVASGLGALRAYKPGESRDRDWNLALARHDVKVRVVGPIARTEITETFRNDSAATLEGVYQFPLPPDAQIDGLALDSAGGFVDGAFVDKERGAKIWRGVIDKATPRTAAHPSQEIIWVEGRWRDPALLDWKRGGRFELRVYPIPAHGARTIKLAYTQVVAPRGSWRQYSYPLPHSRDGSTVADQFTVDVELRGAEPGMVRTAGYDLVPDPARGQVNALTLRQSGFVPRGDLVIDYRATDGDAELRAWTFAGGAAAAPDDKLATRKNVGIDPKVVEAQRAIAADLRPTAVVALRPEASTLARRQAARLPDRRRWQPVDGRRAVQPRDRAGDRAGRTDGPPRSVRRDGVRQRVSPHRASCARPRTRQWARLAAGSQRSLRPGRATSSRRCARRPRASATPPTASRGSSTSATASRRPGSAGSATSSRRSRARSGTPARWHRRGPARGSRRSGSAATPTPRSSRPPPAVEAAATSHGSPGSARRPPPPPRSSRRSARRWSTRSSSCPRASPTSRPRCCRRCAPVKRS